MKFLTGCLAIIGGIVALFMIIFIVAVIGAATHGSPGNLSSTQNSHHHTKSTHPASIHEDPCSIATKRANTALAYFKQGAYQSAYDAAVSGLNYNEQCADDDAQLVNKAYLLSHKALAEHHLSSGDSATDLNQADQLLVECQTRPSLYGTQAAAGCETEEDANISYKTNWELNSE